MLKTRFAPSPTGYLHVGGARTALFCYLYAKKHQGKFALRIEDTDRERSTQASVQAILDAMAWLNLDYDEGPVYQTARFDRYREVIEQLLAERKAYKCYCSKERLEQLREQQMDEGIKPRYDGHCRHLESSQDGPFVIRFKNPQDGEVSFTDFVRGEITVSNAELDDLIIQRSDGTPTYNFSVVIDDVDMQMTHVIRGDDHINNTPRQINLFKALGAEPPLFGHVPMILGEDGKRLSKRHGAVSVMQYRDEGYFPEALLNYLVRLGWSHGDQEIFSMEEMIAHFDVAHISRSPAIFNPEKLDWLNAHYMKTLPTQRIVEELIYHMKQQAIDLSQGPSLEALVEVFRERAVTLEELANSSRYFYEDVEHYEEKAAKKHLKPKALEPLTELQSLLVKLPRWEDESIHQAMQAVTEKLAIGMGKVGQPLRVAVTGGSVSPPMAAVLALLGREKSLARLDKAIAYIKANNA